MINRSIKDEGEGLWTLGSARWRFQNFQDCFWPNAELRVAEIKLLCKLHINENSFGLAAEAYWRLTSQCWSIFCYKLLTSMVRVCHKLACINETWVKFRFEKGQTRNPYTADNFISTNTAAWQKKTSHTVWFETAPQHRKFIRRIAALKRQQHRNTANPRVTLHCGCVQLGRVKALVRSHTWIRSNRNNATASKQ